MKVMIVGCVGQAGKNLMKRVPSGWGLATDCSQLDITNARKVSEIVWSFCPDIIINVAAYKAVDKAETESDATGPIGVYDRSQLEGRLATVRKCSEHVIIRTAWVLVEHGLSFVQTMIHPSRERELRSIVSEAFGSTTYTGDVAAAIIAMLSKSQLSYGVYHFCGDTAVSWFDFAQTIFKEAQACELYPHQVKVNPIASHEYPTPASRPAYSILSTDKICALNPRSSPWKQPLNTVLHKVLSQ